MARGSPLKIKIHLHSYRLSFLRMCRVRAGRLAYDVGSVLAERQAGGSLVPLHKRVEQLCGAWKDESLLPSKA